jgi:flagellar export protein FliJ
MSFHFSLATVLRVRGILEEREETMLQKILFEIAQSLEALACIDAEIAQSDSSRCANVFKPFIGRNLHASYGEVKELMQNKKELEIQMEKLEELRDRQIKVYEEARRNREMLTEMREEKRCIYETDMARREQKTLDDTYISRRARI